MNSTRTVDTPSTADARAMDLIRASGVLNPNLTLDKLMEVSRELGELEPAGDGRPTVAASMTFIAPFYIYKQVQR